MRNEIYLNLGIWDFNDISHSDISQHLGIQPTKIHVIGEKTNPKFSILSKENGWILSSNVSKHSPFDDHMDALISVIEDKSDLFKRYSLKYYSELSCALNLYYDNGESIPSIHIDGRYSKFLQEFNIEFDLDIYCLPNEE